MPSWMVDFLFLPIIGAVHGYLTNVLAIRLLFRPRRPIRLFGLAFQGVIPRRREDLALSIGQTVERELLRGSDIFSALRSSGLEGRLVTHVQEALRDRLATMVPRLVPGPLRHVIERWLEDAVMKEVAPLLGDLLGRAEHELSEQNYIGNLITDRLRAFELHDLEALVRSVAGKELRWIEWLGLFMGLGIGTVQGVFLLLVGR